MGEEKLRELVANYQPNDRVLASMADIKILAAVGPTASGKTTLMATLAENNHNYKVVLDETSRKPRPGEKQGVDFLFRSREEIIDDAKAGNLVQIALGPNDDLYCTRLENYPHNGTGLIALVPAAVKEFRKLPVASFEAAFIVPRTYELWQSWLTKQARDSHWSDEQLNKRLQEAKQSFEFALADRHIKFVLNDDTQRSVKRLMQVAKGTSPDDESLATSEASKHYHKLRNAIDIK